MELETEDSVFTCTDTVGWQVGESVIAEGWNSRVVNSYNSAVENRIKVFFGFQAILMLGTLCT